MAAIRLAVVLTLCTALNARAAGAQAKGAGGNQNANSAAGAGGAAQVATPNPDFVDSPPVTAWFRSSGDSLIGHVQLLVNNAKAPAFRIAAGFIARDERDTIVAMTVDGNAASIDSNAVQPVALTVVLQRRDLPAGGQLLLTFDGAPGGKVVTKLIALHLVMTSPAASAQMTLVTLALAFLAVVIAFARRKNRDTTLSSPMGPAHWDFKATWASNITVFGTIVTSVLSFTALPADTRYLTHAQYLSMSLLWTLVIALAPAVYSFLRTPAIQPVPEAAASAAPDYDGYVGGFLIAALFTLWAVFGQLATLGYLVVELGGVHLIPPLALWSFEALLGFVALGLLVYGYRSVIDTIAYQAAAEVPRQANVRRAQKAFAENVAAPPLPTRRPAWHPL